MTKHGINLNFVASGVSIPQQLEELKNAGVKRVRLNILRFDVPLATMIVWRGYTFEALKMGFEHVIFGVGGGSTILTDANKEAYRQTVIREAMWAQSVGDPRLELQVGNEVELHTALTAAQTRAFIREMFGEAHAIYTKGIISYSSSVFVGNEVQLWANEGLGNYARVRIGFNMYGSDNAFRLWALALVANFGNRGFVSEWGTNNGYIDYNNEGVFARTIARRRQILISAGIVEAYYYNFMESGNRWGAKMYPITGNFRLAWPAILGKRPWFVGNPNIKFSRPKKLKKAKYIIRPKKINKLIF